MFFKIYSVGVCPNPLRIAWKENTPYAHEPDGDPGASDVPTGAIGKVVDEILEECCLNQVQVSTQQAHSTQALSAKVTTVSKLIIFLCNNLNRRQC